MVTKIEWATEVWNPVTGCTKVSAGCKNCYAERMSKRFGWPWEVTLHHDRLDNPLHWRKPRRVFVCSMGDLFHEDVSDLFICKVMDIVQKCPQHTFLVLTKRAKRMSQWPVEGSQGIISNLWLGVSVEDCDRLGRIDTLRDTPAAVRFISFEPMLGDVGEVNLDGIGWVICGGESGPGARPMNIEWARSLKDQCVYAGVPFFFKQARINGKMVKMPTLDGKKWEQYPGEGERKEGT